MRELRQCSFRDDKAAANDRACCRMMVSVKYGVVLFAFAVPATMSRAGAQPAEPDPSHPSEPAAEPAVEQPAPPADAPPPVEAVEASSAPLADRPSPPPPAQLGSEKSPVLAGALSLGVTAAGITLLAFSMDIAPHYDEKGSSDLPRIGVVTSGVLLTLVGPTTGHIYAGRTWSSALKWRLIGVGVAAVTFLPAFGFAYAEKDGLAAVFGLLVAGGAGTYIGATLLEIVTAPRAARRHNERLAGDASISIAPLIGRAPGLAIGGRF